MRAHLFFVSALLIACGDNYEAAPPTYIEIDRAVLFADEGAGGNSHAITESWVYADSIFVGAYHMPTRFPLILEASGTLEIFAGIRRNGLGSDLAIYPFYTRSRHVVVPLVENSLEVEFEYLPNVIFPLIETFDGTHRFDLDLDGDRETMLVSTTDNSLDGSSGRIALTASNPTFEVASSHPIASAARTGQPIYIEFDFRSSIDWQVGFGVGPGAGQISTRYILQLTPTEDWQKIYLDLTSELQGVLTADFHIVMRSLYNPDVVGPQFIQVDNLKLVHFAP